MTENRKPIKTVGIVLNPAAGDDCGSKQRIFQKVMSCLENYKILLAPGNMGADYCNVSEFNEKIVGDIQYFDRRDTIAIAQTMAESGAELIIGIGGDGTQSDIAYGISKSGLSTCIVGVGIGSTNVGSLIRFKENNLDELNPNVMHEFDLDCILVYHQGTFIGFGFNDCVIGTTIVGTLDGKQVDLDAALRMHGKKVIGHSESIGTRNTIIKKNGKILINGDRAIPGQIVAGPLDDRYLGKAVSGLLCWSSFMDYGAALVVSPVPLVQVNVDCNFLATIEPLDLKQFLFDGNDRIEISGIQTGSTLCLDGNPHVLLKEEDIIEIQYKHNAIKTLR